MNEIEAMQMVSTALEPLKVDERIRVLGWANQKYGDGQMGNSATQKVTPSSVGKSKSGKKIKSVLSMDKTLNLSPQGQKSAAEFASENLH